MNPFLLIIYAAAIFSIGTVGGLMALRRLEKAALRAVFFLALCYAVLSVTFWLAARWSLDPVAVGSAWAVALAVVIAVEAVIRIRRKRDESRAVPS